MKDLKKNNKHGESESESLAAKLRDVKPTKCNRTGKVLIDSRGDVVIETLVQELERRVARRLCEAQVLNKAQAARYVFLQKQIEAARRIYRRKILCILNEHKKFIKEHIALRHVLKDLTQQCCSESDPKCHGIVPKLELQALIEQRIKDCSSTSRRIRATRKLLQVQRPTMVIDKGMSITELLQAAKLRRINKAQIDMKENLRTINQKPNVLPPVTSSEDYSHVGPPKVVPKIIPPPHLEEK